VGNIKRNRRSRIDNERINEIYGRDGGKVKGISHYAQRLP
jgi:hypothetical protein